jgi:hypothetical protein
LGFFGVMRAPVCLGEATLYTELCSTIQWLMNTETRFSRSLMGVVFSERVLKGFVEHAAVLSNSRPGASPN